MRGPRPVPALGLSVLGVLCCAVGALPQDGPAQPIVASVATSRFIGPPPTEHWLGEDAESRNKSRRKAFYQRIHRAPPDVDWTEVERKNGLANLARRNALSLAPPVDDGTARWQERGSDNQAGRIHVARLSPDGTTLYAGSSLGGVWRGEVDGTGWTPIGDNLYGGAHWLEVMEGDSAVPVVLAATDGGLVHRTEDDGATWVAPTGLDGPSSVRRLLRLRDGTDALWMVTAVSGQVAVRRSVDDGANFELKLDLGEFLGDAWAPRDGGTAVYVATASGIQHSADGGETWTVQGPLPTAASRAELVGSEAGAPRLWMVLDRAQLYRSDDAGETWASATEVSDYWGTLNASIHDEDLFAWGGVHVHRTANGGADFAYVNNWWDYYGDPENLLHADIPGLDVEIGRAGDERWYVDTDGGLYHSLDGLQTVQNLSLDGLRVSQYYDVLTSSANPAHIAAGAQDQGYQVTNTLDESDGEIARFDQLLSGDYGHLTSSDGSHDYVYSVYPGFVLIQIGEDDPVLRDADFPEGASTAWLPPIVADPLDPTAFFFSAQQLYHYTRGPDGWTPEVWSEQDFSGGGSHYISALAFSPVDPDRAYVATSAGLAYHSEDRGRTWTKSHNLSPYGNYLYGQAIVASASDVDTVWLGGSGYSSPAILRSTDGGVSFQPFDTGIGDTLVYCMAEAPDGSGTLVAGTQQSVFRRDPSDDEWVEITGVDAPVTTYWSVETLTAENTFRFATYGRGIWDYQLDPDGTGCYPVQDYDGDGVDCTEDCDDLDAFRAPGLDEVCDGVDQNCDPTDVDEADEDGDGHPACGDCDDNDAGVSPTAVEICGNLIDEDCDGADLDCEAPDPGPEPQVPAGSEPVADPSDDGEGKDTGRCATVDLSGALSTSGLVLGWMLVVARRRP